MTGSPGCGYSGRGLVPRSIEWLLRHAAQDERSAPLEDSSVTSVAWTIRASALEIYNERLLDLLDERVSADPLVAMQQAATGMEDAGTFVSPSSGPSPLAGASQAASVHPKAKELIPTRAAASAAAESRRAGLKGPALAFGRASAPAASGALRVVSSPSGGVEVRGLR